MRIRNLLLPALLGAIVTLSAIPAQAGEFKLVLSDETRGESVTIYDGGALDNNGQVDSIANYSFLDVGEFQVFIHGTVFNLAPGGETTTAATVQMNLSNFLLQTNKAGKFTATLTRTGVPGSLFGGSLDTIAEYNALYHVPGSGRVTFQSWVNGQEVMNVYTDDDTLPGPPPPTVNAYSIDVGAEFSIVSKLTFDMVDGGSVQADSALRLDPEPVPEPTTLLLFGPGMLGLAALRRRFQSKVV